MSQYKHIFSHIFSIVVFCFLLLLSACDSTDESPVEEQTPIADGIPNEVTDKDEPIVVVPLLDAPDAALNEIAGQLQFSWNPVDDAHHYKVIVDPDGLSGYTAIAGGENISDTFFATSVPVSTDKWSRARYRVSACSQDESECSSSEELLLRNLIPVVAVAYVKASNTTRVDWFGHSVSISNDGNTVAVGAIQEDSGGAVYIYKMNAGVWQFSAYVQGTDTLPGDRFGDSVALSGDGNTLAVGAIFKGNGFVYVFTRSGDVWTEQDSFGSETGHGFFGDAVELDYDGNTLAASDTRNSVSASGVDPLPPYSGGLSHSGAVWVFVRDASDVWSQQSYIKEEIPGEDNEFGNILSLCDDGNTLAVGAAGLNGQHSKAYVYSRAGSGWSFKQTVVPVSTRYDDWYGISVALSSDCLTLAVGATREDSSATGVNGNQNDNSLIDSGAVYIFYYVANSWIEGAYIKAENTDRSDSFGLSVALDADGDTLSVGVYSEDGAALDNGGSELDNSAMASGAAYIYTRSGDDWAMQNYLKAPNAESGDWFGYSIDLSADGNLLTVGALGEDSSAIEVDGNMSNNDAQSSGAVYIY